MLSRPQQILLKRAQREAGLSDDDYRDALQMVAGCRSSTSPALTDRHMDKLLGYFEAIFFRAVDAGILQPCGGASAVFRQRNYWSNKNTNQETSRERYNRSDVSQAIADLECRLNAMGFGPAYCESIREKVAPGRTDAHGLNLYRAALIRTVTAKSMARERTAIHV